MSVCAVMMARDEADIIEATLRHLRANVDACILLDNASTDETPAIVWGLIEEWGDDWLTYHLDEDIAYYQSRKTTRLAMQAMKAGHQWVLPVDADEIVYANGRTVADLLSGIAPDVMVVISELFNHLATALDDPNEANPIKRLGWRQRGAGALPKVCARLRPDLVITQGNHGAKFQGTGLRAPGLVTRHFSWRSPEQYLRKIRNGQAAYAATNLPDSMGAHWRMFEHATDEAILEHFHSWFFSRDPYADDTLIFDPAPAAGL